MAICVGYRGGYFIRISKNDFNLILLKELKCFIFTYVYLYMFLDIHIQKTEFDMSKQIKSGLWPYDAITQNKKRTSFVFDHMEEF